MACCDKCGREVDPTNNATLVESLAFSEPMVMLFNGDRHLLPVVENGVVVCEGSPSRAQYIEGRPRDTRGYPYDLECETRYRAGYAEVLSRYGDQTKKEVEV